MSDLGRTARAARKAAGLDQRDPAGLAGVGLRFLSCDPFHSGPALEAGRAAFRTRLTPAGPTPM